MGAGHRHKRVSAVFAGFASSDTFQEPDTYMEKGHSSSKFGASAGSESISATVQGCLLQPGYHINGNKPTHEIQIAYVKERTERVKNTAR
jgi:hypothetical protein